MPWQSSEHILGSKYEYSRVLNMQRVTQGSIYATIWLNMPEYVWIYDNRQGSEYVSYNT